MKAVSVLIPYQPDGGDRDRVFNWVRQRYAQSMPKFELCIGEYLNQPFSRARAINTAAGKATGEVFVIADADLVYDPAMIVEAMKLLNTYAWVIPYRRVLHLRAHATERVLCSHPNSIIRVAPSDVRRVRIDLVGGLNVVPRSHFELVDGFDDRFVGWGKEDQAFAYAMDTLCGAHGRIEAELFHLHHPKSGLERRRSPYYQANVKLHKRYRATGQPAAMKQLIEERRA